MEVERFKHRQQAPPLLRGSPGYGGFLLPLGEIIRNPDAAGRIAKWSVELMGEMLAYASCKAIKSQILADFVAEWTDTQLPPPQIQDECWTLYFDGSVMKTGVGAGLHFVSPLGDRDGNGEIPVGDQSPVPVLVPANTGGGQFVTIPVPVGDFSPRRGPRPRLTCTNYWLT
jgi:hypothetical protein